MSSLFFSLVALVTAFFQTCTNGQFTGTLSVVGTELSGIVLVTIENPSTANYSVEARNNLFDDTNPYQPVSLKDLSGHAVPLMGEAYSYGQLTDSSFVSMPPGAVWERELNMTEYLYPSSSISAPQSNCYVVSSPPGLWAINTTSFTKDEDLATGLLSESNGTPNLVEIFITVVPLHLNLTTVPQASSSSSISPSYTTNIPSQPVATLAVPSATAGVGGIAPEYGTNIDAYIPNNYPGANIAK